MAEEESFFSESSPEEEPPSVKRRRLDKGPELGHYLEEKLREMLDNSMATIKDGRVRSKAKETAREEHRRLDRSSRNPFQQQGFSWQINQIMKQLDNEAIAKGEAILSRATEDHSNVG